jgi:hypothetical protein
MSLGRIVKHRLFGIAPDEALFARRGFRPADPRKQARLEDIGRTFVAGYRIALDDTDVDTLQRRLDETPAVMRGFAYEGAAMGLTLLDHLWPRRVSRFTTFLNGPGAPHGYMLHVGHGWAIARLPWRRLRLDRPTVGLLHWLRVDGYGFHEGYFHWGHRVQQQERPRALRGYACRAFDQGLGRSLWFINGADVERTADCLSAFDADRHADLWSGVGLAVTYAGGASADELRWLRQRAGRFAPHVAQGAAFAAGARDLAGNPAEHSDAASCVLCGMPAADAAGVTDVARVTLRPVDALTPDYECWRTAVREAVGSLASVLPAWRAARLQDTDMVSGDP